MKGVLKAKRRSGTKRPTVLALQTVLDRHAKRLDEQGEQIGRLDTKVQQVEELPQKFAALKHDFASLRNDVTAPIGDIGLHQRAATRVLMGVAAKLEVEVAASDLKRLEKLLPGEPGYTWGRKV